MDWTNDTVMRFLELYRTHPCIWDPKNVSYKNKSKCNDAWIDIKSKLGMPYTIKEIKKKKESLMAAYRGYRIKILKSETSGGGSSQVYQPIWYAYPFMDSFLGNVYKYTPSTKSDGQQNDKEAIHSYNFSVDSSDDLDYTDSMDIKTADETNAANHEQESSSNELLEHEYANPLSPHTLLITPTAIHSKRRQYYPPEIHQTQRHMDQAIRILNNVSQHHLNIEEDECTIYGKLVAAKMRKLTEDRRDFMMIKINQLFYDECHERDIPNTSETTETNGHETPIVKREPE